MKQKNKYPDGWTKVKCPVCKQTKLVSGLRVHIITKAKQEVYDWYLWYMSEDRDDTESPETPHQTFIEKKVKLITITAKKWDL